jgi:16S rRNA processing protein RimM
MSPPPQETQEPLIILARAVRSRGLKGEIVAELLTDFPERFEQVSELVGVAPTGERRLFTLESYWLQNGRLIIKFAGYNTVETANTLVGYEFGLPEEQRMQLPSDEFYDWELEGCSVETAGGAAVGKVREVMRTGGVELLVVTDDARREQFIPMTQSIVIDVDVAAKKILIDPPEGLLDL